MVVAAITLLLTVGLGRVTSKYVRVDVRYNCNVRGSSVSCRIVIDSVRKNCNFALRFLSAEKDTRTFYFVSF